MASNATPSVPRPTVTPPSSLRWSLWPLLLLATVLPLIAAIGSYLISASTDQVPWCWPMFEGCTSISRAARVEPAIFLFRVLMLPQALLLVVLWLAVTAWLGHHGQHRGLRSIFLAGLVGALALALYVSFLGSSGDFYQFMRRFGITFHFAGTGLAQLLVVYRLQKLALPASAALRWLWYLVAAQWLLAMLHVILKASLADYDAWENRLEWSLALLMTFWFGALAVQARQDRWQLQFHRGD